MIEKIRPTLTSRPSPPPLPTRMLWVYVQRLKGASALGHVVDVVVLGRCLFVAGGCLLLLLLRCRSLKSRPRGEIKGWAHTHSLDHSLSPTKKGLLLFVCVQSIPFNTHRHRQCSTYMPLKDFIAP